MNHVSLPPKTLERLFHVPCPHSSQNAALSSATNHSVQLHGTGSECLESRKSRVTAHSCTVILQVRSKRVQQTFQMSTSITPASLAN